MTFLKKSIKLYFYKFKTAKLLGRQIVDYLKPAAILIKSLNKYNLKYFLFNDYLLLNSNDNNFSNINLNNRLDKIFDKGISNKILK